MTQPKFVQIAAMPSDGSQHDRALYALDEAGVVWWFDRIGKVWESMPSERVAPPSNTVATEG